MISYKDKTFCTAKCENIKCHRMIGYSQMRHAEKLGLPVAFADLGEGCKDKIEPKKSPSVSK